MDIQDDMYDVEATVKGTDAEDAFERFSRWASQMEVENVNLLQDNTTLRRAIKIVKDGE